MKQKLVKNAAGEMVWVDANRAATAPQRAGDAPVCGEALGCIENQVDVFRAEAKLRNLPVEYVEDPDVKGFYNARCANQRDWNRVAKFYGLEQKGQSGADVITAAELQQASDLVWRRYPARS